MSTDAKYLDPDDLPEGTYLWNIDKAESDRLSKLLDVDFATFGYLGHFVEGKQVNCQNCGKVSGLDDFVHSALKGGVHTKQFMVEALTGNKPNFSPPHKLQCCICDTIFKEPSGNECAIRGWATGSGFNYARVATEGDVEGNDVYRRWKKGYRWLLPDA